MPDGHPLTVGHCSAQAGKTDSRECGFAARVLAVALRRSIRGVGRFSLPDRQVQLDPDPRELGREYPIEAGAAGDLAQSIPQLAEVAAGYTADWGDFVDHTRVRGRVQSRAGADYGRYAQFASRGCDYCGGCYVYWVSRV